MCYIESGDRVPGLVVAAKIHAVTKIPIKLWLDESAAAT